MATLQLSQFMTCGIETLPPDARLAQLANVMSAQRLSCVVITEQGRPVGMVSERDCVRVLSEALAGRSIDELRACDVMTSPVITASSDLTWIEALELVKRRRIRRLPVVNGEGLLMGLVTQSDLLEAQRLAFQFHREEFEVAIADRTRELTKARDDAERALHGNMEFLATMTHELRTPLSGVVSVAELLEDTSLNQQQAEWVKTITSSGRALGRLVDDILDYAKMEASQVEVETIEFDLLEVLEEVADLLGLKAQSKQVELRLVYDPLVPLAMVSDPARIRQLITNLCGNAVKFTEGGEVSVHVNLVEVQGKSARLRVEVRDTGIGIPPDRQARLFEPYSQADPSISRRFGGTGLGLAISRKLVEALGGEIGVSSTQGVGSTFWFELKVGYQARTPIEPPAREQVIAVIDESPTTATDLRRLLSSLGVQVPMFGTVPEAISALADGARMDCAFVRYPVRDNEEKSSLESFLEQMGSAAVFLVTDIADHALAAGMAHHGYAGALTRPVKRRPLCDALASLLDLPTIGSKSSRRLRVQNRLARENYRLLLAEDNKVNQMVISQQLRRLGFECTVVGDGEQAVSAFRERSWDLILMDNRMPLMDGVEATRAIRRIEAERDDRPTAILSLTASNTTNERARCAAAGMNGYLTKPISIEELEVALDEHLQMNRGRTLSDEQLDAIAEIINIGIGRGAAELSEMIGLPIELQVPAVEAIYDGELANLASGMENGNWSCIQLGFDGNLRGSSALLLSERGSAGLVGALEDLDPPPSVLTDEGAQTITEVANIVLNALVGSFANALDQVVRFEVPSYSRGSVSKMVASDLYFGAHTLLMARTHVAVRDIAVEGIVLLVLGLGAFDRLLRQIEADMEADMEARPDGDPALTA